MVLTFPRDVMERLKRIEETEGVPDVEVVHLAVEIFSHLTGPERRILGITAMQLVAARDRGGIIQ